MIASFESSLALPNNLARPIHDIFGRTPHEQLGGLVIGYTPQAETVARITDVGAKGTEPKCLGGVSVGPTDVSIEYHYDGLPQAESPEPGRCGSLCSSYQIIAGQGPRTIRWRNGHGPGLWLPLDPETPGSFAHDRQRVVGELLRAFAIAKSSQDAFAPYRRGQLAGIATRHALGPALMSIIARAA